MTYLIYARVSSKEQEREGFSIPAQLELLREYAKKHDLKISKEYIDNETAKESGRVAFDDMCNAMQDTQGVLVEKVDRLYRNFRDYVTVDDLLLAGKEVHFVKQGLVLNKESKSQDKLIHDIQVVLARNYINNLSEETKKGMLEKVKQGGYYGWAPLGYTNENKGIIPDPGIAPYIVRAYELYETGRSIRDVARYLNMAGLKGKMGGKISNNTVHWLLTNPVYIGKVRYKGQIYNGTHVPLIEKELFYSVSKRLHLKTCNRKGKPRKRFPLRGLLTCSCGRHMTAETKKGHIYYHCLNKDCNEPYAREDRLMEEVEHLLDDVSIEPKVASVMLRAAREAFALETRRVEDERGQTAKRLVHVSGQMSRLVDSFINGIITEPVYRRRLRELEEEEEGLKNVQASLSQAENIEPIENLIRIGLTCGDIFRDKKGEEKRELLDFVLSNLVISEGNIVSHQLKYPFDLLFSSAPVSTWLPILVRNRTEIPPGLVA